MKKSLFAMLLLISTMSLSALNSIDAGVQFGLPLGDYGDYAGFSFGTGFQINVSPAFADDLIFFFSTEINKCQSKTTWVDFFIDVPLFTGLAYTLHPSKDIEITPELGIGIINHIAYGDVYRSGNSSVDYFLDTAARISLKASYNLNDKIAAYIRPSWIYFFEDDNTGSILGTQLGMSFRF
jgi:hypothetical protein